MRKFLVFGVVVALVVAVAWPVMAADFLFTGIYRTRGIAYDNVDKNDDTHDNAQYYTALWRPRFTATSEGGKVVGFYEIDGMFENGRIWDGQARWPAKSNRWYIDFLVPYTKLRLKTGRYDYAEVGTSHLVYGSGGLNRKSGHWLYGPIVGGLQLSAWTVKRGEGVTEAADTDAHYIALSYNVMPKVTLTAQYSRYNSLPTQTAKYAGAGTPAIRRDYWGANLRGASGIFSGEATYWYQHGKQEYSTSTTDLTERASAGDLRLALNLGDLKLDTFFLWSTGDSDPLDNDMERFMAVGPWAGRNGPILFFGATGINPFGLENRSPSGDGAAWGNGLAVYAGSATYNFTPKHMGFVTGSIIRSAEKRPDTSTITYVSDKDIGFELDFYFQYKPYKSLTIKAQYAYLWMGDYGEQKTPAPTNNDDAWLLGGEIRYDF